VAQEIILHTLFESGITKIQDLERYIKDDVVRHGSRLVDLEKKLVGAYREAVGPSVLSIFLFILTACTDTGRSS
jgi:transcriptional activator SPT7